MTALTIADTSIGQDADGRYCLNDLHRAAGGEKRHQPANWLRLDSTNELIDEIDRSSEMRNALNVIQGGSHQGTYVSKELVYSYAMWISPSFQLKVIRAFDALVNGDLARAQEIAASKVPPSVTHKADHVVSAARCFNGLMRAAQTLRLGQSRAALAANQAAMRHTGVDILDELGVDPDELPEELPRTSASDELIPKIREWLEAPDQAGQDQFTSEAILVGAFGVTQDSAEYRSMVTRLGRAMARLGWPKRRSTDRRRAYAYHRPR